MKTKDRGKIGTIPSISLGDMGATQIVSNLNRPITAKRLTVVSPGSTMSCSPSRENQQLSAAERLILHALFRTRTSPGLWLNPFLPDVTVLMADLRELSAHWNYSLVSKWFQNHLHGFDTVRASRRRALVVFANGNPLSGELLWARSSIVFGR
jgi:hypothetical protein